MKLTDFLSNVGRPVAYYPSLRKITGSTTATILLCQFIYWRGKEADPDGWLFKTSEDIEAETGLTYNEQKTARRSLIDAGLIEEHYARLDHQMKFRVDLEAINEKWATLQANIPESDDSTLGNDGSPFSLNSNSEITTEITNNGDESPHQTNELPLEWKILAGQEVTELPDQDDARRKDAANLIATGMGSKSREAYALCYEFMAARKIVIPHGNLKGQRKPVKAMLDSKVKPEHIRQAVDELTSKNMTITDLFSVSKTAMDLANKPQTQSEYPTLS